MILIHNLAILTIKSNIDLFYLILKDFEKIGLEYRFYFVKYYEEELTKSREYSNE